MTTPLLATSPTLRSFVKFELAETLTSLNNVDARSLGSFFTQIVEGQGRVRVLNRHALRSRLLATFHELRRDVSNKLAPPDANLSGSDEDAIGDLARYLRTGDDANRSDKEFQLADKLARLFVLYDLWSPAFLTKTTSQEHTWQRSLWHKLWGPDGSARQLGRDGDSYIMLGDGATSALQRSDISVPPSVYVIAPTLLEPRFYTLLGLLSRRTHVHIYAVNPCAEYWEDIPDRAQIGPRDNVALSLWGRAGRDHIRRLNELAQHDFQEHYVSPPNPDSLLGDIKADIAARRPAHQAAKHEGGAHDADTPSDARLARNLSAIELHACPTPRREVEVIAERIWELIRTTPSLHFEDIAVAIPREQQAVYYPLVRAVFEEIHRLPYSLAGMELTSESSLAEAGFWLIDLPSEPITRGNLLRIMSHPNIRGRFANADSDLWDRWCQQLGVAHGADQHDHEGTYIHGDLYNWDQALRRLVLGSFMVQDTNGDGPQSYRVGSDSYIPLASGPALTQQVGSFVSLARSLLADARRCQRTQMPLHQWSRWFVQLLSGYLTANTKREQRSAARFRDAALSLADNVSSRIAVDYRTAALSLRARLAEVSVDHGQSLSSGVVVADPGTLAALPFPVCFVAGLSEGQFARDRKDSLDLRAAVGLVSNAERERYQFLQLVTASDRLILSYICRDPLTGDALAPASIVHEMTQVAGDYGYDTLPTQTHALRNYEDQYFGATYGVGQDNLSCSPVAHRRARAVALRRAAKTALGAVPPLSQLRGALGDDGQAEAVVGELFRFDNAASAGPKASEHIEVRATNTNTDADAPVAADLASAAPATDIIDISLAMLRRFLESPLQAWASFTLGLREDNEDTLDVGDEPYAPDFAPWLVSLRDVAATAFSDHGGSLEFALSQCERLGKNAEMTGQGPTGLFLEANVERGHELLQNWWQGLEQAARSQEPGRPTLTVVPDDASDTSAKSTRWQRAVMRNLGPNTAMQSLPPLELDELGPTTRVRLSGTLSLLGPPTIGAVTLIPGRRVQAKHWLRGFIDFLALTASGLRDDSAFVCTAVTSDGKYKQAQLSAWTQNDARAYLTTLASSLINDSHAYLLPCEAVFDAHANPKLCIAALVDKLRRSQRPALSCAYGPIRDLGALSPPANTDTLIEHRFAAFFASFQELS